MDRTSWVQFPAWSVTISFRHRVQTESGSHPASYPVSTAGSFPGGRAAGTWGCTSTPSTHLRGTGTTIPLAFNEHLYSGSSVSRTTEALLQFPHPVKCSHTVDWNSGCLQHSPDDVADSTAVQLKRYPFCLDTEYHIATVCS